MNKTNTYTSIKFRICGRNIAGFNVCHKEAAWFYHAGRRKNRIYACNDCKRAMERRGASDTRTGKPTVFFQIVDEPT